jgi:hypothetical protein
VFIEKRDFRREQEGRSTSFQRIGILGLRIEIELFQEVSGASQT